MERFLLHLVDFYILFLSEFFTEDYRSVDELLEFIGEAPSKSAKSKDAGESENSSKKKKKKKKDKKKANNGFEF